MRSLAVVPAAGSAERFGSAKLLVHVDGQPLIDRTIASLRAGGVEGVVLVVTDASAHAGRDARVVVNPDPSRGMFSSLQEGLREAGADALVILPGDMPFVTPATVRSLLQVFEARHAIVSPRYGGKRGHPVVLPGGLREEILAAPPTGTLHDVIRAHHDERVDLDVDDRGVLRDVDRPEDLTHA